MPEGELAFYASPAAMTVLPDHPLLASMPDDPGALRATVQGLLVHRDWASAYGLSSDEVRLGEQNLRSTREVLHRAFEICEEPVTVARQPVDRVLSICRHYTLLHTAFLRANGVPARVRCGFSNYFDPSKWYDHWITERWDDGRWIREDPQIDDLQADVIKPDFDPYDQPPGKFLSGDEAWHAVRAGDLDADLFGILDMWGRSFVAGNVLLDLACLNKVELLPWDVWGIGMQWGPHDTLSEEIVQTVDELAVLVTTGGFDKLRARYLTGEDIRVPADIVSIIDGEPTSVHLEIWISRHLDK